MKEIVLDAQGWKSQEDFFVALLPELGAPSWHGHNLDALWDSLVAGQINSTKPPYSITVFSADKLPEFLKVYLLRLEELIKEMQTEGVEIQIKFTPSLGSVARNSN